MKTRLATAIGEASASIIYRHSLTTLLTRCETLAESRCLVFTPDQRHGEFEQLAGEHWQVQPQASGDLGARLRAFFATAFAAGAARVVVIGSDSPTLPRSFIVAAFQRLDTHRVVLGPTADGGYYLVGAAKQVPPIFDDIPWSSSQVWAQTVARLEHARCPFAALPEWYDIDTTHDLRRLDQELRTPACDDEAYDELRAAVRRVCGP